MRLLKNPDKVNTIADDLESIFWVLVYVVVKRFAPPEATFPIEIFHEAFDDHGRRIGGQGKIGTLSLKTSYDLNLRHAPLAKLLRDSRDIWYQHRYCIVCTLDFGVEAIDRAFRRSFQLAPDPAYWRERFAMVLEQLGKASDDGDHAADASREQSARSRAEHGALLVQRLSGGKRKADDIHDDPVSPMPLRRSKRLKARHSR